MFEILKHTNLDFMGRRTVLLSISALLVVASVVVVIVNGLNLGIEFTGGSELQLRFASAPDIGGIRSALTDAGMTNQVVTTIGDPAENEVYIRLGTAEAAAEERDPISDVVAALKARFGGTGAEGQDLNITDQATLERVLREAPGVTGSQARALAAAILERRKDVAIIHDVAELSDIEGVTPEVLDYLSERCFVGPIAVRSQSYIGPAVGRELMNKALWAIIGSLIGMMIYIWIRFQIEWGFAAVLALTHDTLITLGLFSLFNKEMSLPVVAAFLTLIGYSVNDTVVVFDRIRENLRKKQTTDLAEVINLSINQTLSRTIITSGLTWIVVFGLLLFGGAALNPFSFVLTIGVIVGTYSSIYIASPILVLWRQLMAGRKGSRSAVSAAPRSS